MSKSFLVAVIRANGTRWSVHLSDSTPSEVFVGKAGALFWVQKTIAAGHPVQAVCYRPGSDKIDEAWFFEKGTKRKLNVIV